ncbi:MAG: GGDEF domain-containing protein [Acidiferrobacteraceae bacterium]|jgi:diguanylate cyclase (GGDEF)-like protein
MSHTHISPDKTAEEWEHERIAISDALLDATASLATGDTVDAVLRTTCNALVSASSHIRLAWKYLGPYDAETIVPMYTVGPEKDYADGLALANDKATQSGPTRTSLRTLRPVITVIRTSEPFAPWRERAMAHGLEACASFPFGNRESDIRGAVAIYVNREDYFEQVGLEPFIAFANLAQAAFDQALLREKLEELATFDAMTGLLTRHTLQQMMEHEHARARRRESSYSLVLFDVDRFKVTNDHFGHQAGDKVLVGIAEITRDFLRESDLVSRWGGEEFLCLLPDTGIDEASTIAERLRREIATSDIHIDSQDRTLRVTISAGVASYPDHAEMLRDVLNTADAALYEAKRSGRDRVISGESGRHQVFSIAGELEDAIKTKRMVAAFQPIVDLKTGDIVGEEALARLRTESGELLEAGRFIEAAAQMQLTHRIDQEIILQSMDRCVLQVSTGMPINHFVNVSPELLRHPHLVQSILEQAQVRCQCVAGQLGAEKPLVIEITEREFLGDTAVAREILAPLIDFGFRIAVDDFGSGYSSFQYLADLPVSFLKIEGSLVQRVKSEPRVRSILQGIRDIAGELDLITIAEYVDNEKTVDVLREIGIHLAQGYYFGRPEIH